MPGSGGGREDAETGVQPEDKLLFYTIWKSDSFFLTCGLVSYLHAPQGTLRRVDSSGGRGRKRRWRERPNALLPEAATKKDEVHSMTRRRRHSQFSLQFSGNQASKDPGGTGWSRKRRMGFRRFVSWDTVLTRIYLFIVFEGEETEIPLAGKVMWGETASFSSPES